MLLIGWLIAWPSWRKKKKKNSWPDLPRKSFIYGLPILVFLSFSFLCAAPNYCPLRSLQKVKFWGLIFQSGPRNRQSSFWKTATVKSEKVKLLPLCHRTLRQNWTTRGNWADGIHFLHRKRSSMFLFKGKSSIFSYLRNRKLLHQLKKIRN